MDGFARLLLATGMCGLVAVELVIRDLDWSDGIEQRGVAA
jgi:hypothetical protein